MLLEKALMEFFKWSKTNWTEIKAKTVAFLSEFLSQNQESAHENYTTFYDHIQNVLNSCVPHGFTGTRIGVPWLMRKLKSRFGRKCRLYKAKKPNRTRHWDIYKEYAKGHKKELRQAFWQHKNKILLTAEEDRSPKPFWNCILSQNQDKIGVAPRKSKWW